MNINDLENIIEDMKKNIIPEVYPNIYAITESISLSNTISDIIVKELGFASIAKDWVKIIAEMIGNKKCLEIMAGAGAFSKALSDYGIDIIATDDFSWDKWNNRTKWIDIEDMSAVDAISKYNNVDFILCSWPPYAEPHMYNALMQMRQVNPSAHIIYIGEEYGGCCADDNFFEEAIDISYDDEYSIYINKVSKLYIRRDGMYDKIVIYK